MSSKQAPTEQQTFAEYVECGWQLIPLHRPGDKAKDGRNVGKVPLDRNWTTAKYDPRAVIKRCVREGRNVGVRLTDKQLVIDVDPRNDGEKGFAALYGKLALDPAQWPRVETGSGGSHYYLTLPPGIRVVDTLPDFPGVEFKSRGRQVLAAGSRHPATRRLYFWDEIDHPPLADAPEAPPALIEAIRRPERASAVEGGGQYSAEQIARALAGLDPLDFRDHDTWLRLMMACHHASNGDAREEFVEWSTSDPEYADHDDIIGRRWDSLHRDAPGGVTSATLNKFLADAGRADLQVVPDAADDFPDDLDDDLPDDEAHKPHRLAHVTAENIDEQFALVNVGSKLRLLYWGKSTFDRNVRVPEFWPEEEFHRALRNKFVSFDTKKLDADGNEKTETKRVQLSRWWLTRRNRYTYDGLVFDSDAEEVSEADEINLWRGFGVAENPDGNWDLMRAHIRNVIAAEDEPSADYIMRWIAWGFQNPTRQAEVAVALLSEGRGTGKGFLGRALCRIYGGHALHISKRSLLVGRFNAHFMQTSFLFCDEALWPGHKEDAGALQTLISEPTMTIEPKGINAFTMPNALKIIMASNAKWVVPAAGDDRRYAVFEVSDARKQNKPYFAKLAKELANGGLGAMLHKLRTWDLDGWHPRDNIPQTSALAAQKKQAANPELKWLAGYLESGVLPFQHASFPDRVEADAFYRHARTTVRGLSHWSDWEFAEFLGTWGVTLKRSNGAWRRFPPLTDMRAKWREAMPWWPPFDPRVTTWRSAI